VVGEGQTRQGDRRHARAQIDRLKRGLVEPGALAAQGMANRIGKLFKQGRLLRKDARKEHSPCPRRGNDGCVPFVHIRLILY